MKKTIGSKAICDYTIAKLGISGTHCELTKISEHTYLLVDINSTNGTYVNGRRVRRKVVSPLDTVILAKGKYAFELKIGEVFKKNANQKLQGQKPPAQKVEKIISRQKPVPLELHREFAKLEQVWQAYEEAKGLLKRKERFKRVGVFLTFGLIPFVGSALAIGISGIISADEKKKALDDEFKLNWVCPNPQCKRYFGIQNSWNYIKQKYKACPQCKAKYVKD